METYEVPLTLKARIEDDADSILNPFRLKKVTLTVNDFVLGEMHVGSRLTPEQQITAAVYGVVGTLRTLIEERGLEF